MSKIMEKEIALKTKIIASTEGDRTYAITKTVEGMEGGRGIFVLLYPTRNIENLHVEDSTNVHLLNHMKELGLSSYTVVNLFATVTQSKLSTRGIELDAENMKYIKEKVFKGLDAEKDKVIIAWGNSHQTSKVVNQAKLEVLKLWAELYKDGMLYQLMANGLGKENVGVHPLYMGIRYSNAKWELAQYPHAQVMEALIEEGKKVQEVKKKEKE